MSNYTNCILDQIKELSAKLTSKDGYLGNLFEQKKKQFLKTDPENAEKLAQEHTDKVSKDLQDKFVKRYNNKLDIFKKQEAKIQKQIESGEPIESIQERFDTSRTPEQKAADAVNSEYLHSSVQKQANIMNRLEKESEILEKINTHKNLKGQLDPSGFGESTFTYQNRNQDMSSNFEFTEEFYQSRLSSMLNISDSVDAFRRDREVFDTRDVLNWMIDGKGKDSSQKVFAVKLRRMLDYVGNQRVRLGDAANVRSDKNFMPMSWEKKFITKNIAKFKEWAKENFDWAKMSNFEDVIDQDEWLDNFIKDITSLNSGHYSRVKRKKIFFKNADATYDAIELYGGGYNNMIGKYMKEMSRDLATLQLFGTNPSASKNLIMETIENTKKGVTDKKQLKHIDKNLERFKSYYDANVEFRSDLVSDGAIVAGKTVSYLNTVKLMGSSITNATLDFGNLMMYSGVHKLPVLKVLGGHLKNLAGLISEDKKTFFKDLGLFDERYLRALNGHVRGIGQMQSAQMVDRTTNAAQQLSGIAKITESLREEVAYTNMADLAAGVKDLDFDTFNKGMSELPSKVGLNAQDWASLKKVEQRKVDGATVMFTEDIADISEELAQKVWSYNRKKILDITPEASLKTAKMLGLNYSKGTVFNVIAGTLTNLMSTPASLATNAKRTVESLGQRNKAAAGMFMAKSFVITSAMAAIKIQIDELTKGNTMIDWDNKYLWSRAALSYNVFGVFTEVPMGVFGYGANPIDSPTFSAVRNAAKTAKSGYDVITGDKTFGQFGGNVVDFINKEVNPLKAHPLTKAVNAHVADMARYSMDPKAGKRASKREKKKLKERGQRIYTRGLE
ncbi:MAG: hypothetical protein ACTSP4_00645 [Candidatus Hodarchaeales archaeon]